MSVGKWVVKICYIVALAVLMRITYRPLQVPQWKAEQEAKKEARVSNPSYIASGRLNSNMTDRELLFWICGRIHLIEDKTRRNQEQAVDLTGMASKLDEIHESQTAAATAHITTGANV